MGDLRQAESELGQAAKIRQPNIRADRVAFDDGRPEDGAFGRPIGPLLLSASHVASSEGPVHLGLSADAEKAKFGAIRDAIDMESQPQSLGGR